jgi:uncharacterized protein YqeY
MTLEEQINQAFKEALKGQKSLVLSTLRMVRTAQKNMEKAVKRPLTETELQGVVASQAKLRREAAAEFSKAGRADLAQKEEEELNILLSFLPPQLSPVELEQEVSRLIQDLGAQGPQDLGKVMKAAMAAVAGRADGKVVSDIVRRRLSP